MNRKKSLFLYKKALRGLLSLSLVVVIWIPNTSFIPKALPFGIRTVCIDAGHGGHDPGCLGSSSKEKDIALSISLKLGKMIEEQLPGVKVIYTRKTDKFVELHERASIANKNNADLFICIHCNGGSTTAMGSETYVMGLHKSKENLAVAKRENASVLLEGDYQVNYDGFDPNSDEGNIIFTLFQSAFLDQSLNFAAKVQDQFREVVKRNDRGVKQAGFLVLYRTAMPAVLIETGFLTNKTEEEFLKDAAGQDQMAKAIFDAFGQYKREMDGRSATLDPRSESGEVNKNPETVVSSTPAITFSVQIATSSAPIALTPGNFKGLENVSEIRGGNVYRYVCGKESNLDAASELQAKVRALGFTDAFVVAFRAGERITVSEALKELNK